MNKYIRLLKIEKVKFNKKYFKNTIFTKRGDNFLLKFNPKNVD